MPITVTASTLWERRLFVAIVAIAICLGACSSGWRRVGEQQAEFAQALGARGVRFGPEFDAWARELVDDECLHLKTEAQQLEHAKREELELFRGKLCRPWLQAWETSLKVCERDRPPSWCTGPMIDGVKLQDYFVAVTSALRTSTDNLQRYNTMVVVVSATMPHAITQFPLDRVDQWVAEAAGAFLARATPDDALEIGRLLQHTWVGLGPATARQFTAYATSGALTDQQRRLMNELTTKRHSK